MRFERTEVSSMEAAFAFIRQGIDGGRAVLAMADQPMIICGYEDAADPAQRRLYRVTQTNRSGRWWTWGEFEQEWWAKPGRKALVRVAGQ